MTTAKVTNSIAEEGSHMHEDIGFLDQQNGFKTPFQEIILFETIHLNIKYTISKIERDVLLEFKERNVIITIFF